MCGIAGFLIPSRHFNDFELKEKALKMGEAIAYRGPDAADAWTEKESGIALAHRRLAIVDLSPAGHQPMVSAAGRYIMVYNGEIYNTEDLRKELNQITTRTFRGHSDTEVILECFAQWGIKDSLKKLIGMFAIAVWDRKEKQLTLIRDRLGIKPLYWSLQNNQLFFGSELKALYAHPEWKGDIDKNALASFLRHNYIPGAHTISTNTQKLQPGHFLTFFADLQTKPKLEAFWSIEETVKSGQQHPYQGSDSELVEDLDSLLSDAVKRRMVADVPLGAFLSGGIDSSTIVALMQKQSERPIKTFSIGFNEKGYDEAKHAAEVAKHLKTEHTELYVSPEEAQNVIPKLADMYDEPFSDSSQIPTYLVSEMTQKHVTVALSGDGGDELFAGYNRYTNAPKIVNKLSKFPKPLRHGAAHLMKSFSPQFWDQIFTLIPQNKRPVQAGNKIHKLATVLPEDIDGYYQQLVSHWKNPEDIVLASREPKGVIWDSTLKERIPDDIARMRYLDMKTYLPDDILTKVDRASMAVSLEARVPILDHRVVEFAWRLSTKQMIKNGQGKWPLRQILYKHVPQTLIDRPKMGFGVPIDAWLRGPLKEWAEDLLNPTALKKHGLLNPDLITKKWQEHQSGHRNWQYHLWDILMLQAWCQRYNFML